MGAFDMPQGRQEGVEELSFKNYIYLVGKITLYPPVICSKNTLPSN